jgi:hypothetical protein
MLSRLVDGDARGRKARIGEGPDGDGNERLQAPGLVIDSGTAARAEMKLDAGAFVSHSNVLGRDA